jgi:streptogramin lyase
VGRIDPRSGKLTKRIPIPEGAEGDIAVGLGSVWVVDDSSFVVRIDPGSNAVAGSPLAGSPGRADELEVGSDALWLSGSTDGRTVLRIQP